MIEPLWPSFVSMGTPVRPRSWLIFLVERNCVKEQATKYRMELAIAWTQHRNLYASMVRLERNLEDGLAAVRTEMHDGLGAVRKEIHDVRNEIS